MVKPVSKVIHNNEDTVVVSVKGSFHSEFRIKVDDWGNLIISYQCKNSQGDDAKSQLGITVIDSNTIELVIV